MTEALPLVFDAWNIFCQVCMHTIPQGKGHRWVGWPYFICFESHKGTLCFVATSTVVRSLETVRTVDSCEACGAAKSQQQLKACCTLAGKSNCIPNPSRHTVICLAVALYSTPVSCQQHPSNLQRGPATFTDTSYKLCWKRYSPRRPSSGYGQFTLQMYLHQTMPAMMLKHICLEGNDCHGMQLAYAGKCLTDYFVVEPTFPQTCTYVITFAKALVA